MIAAVGWLASEIYTSFGKMVTVRVAASRMPLTKHESPQIRKYSTRILCGEKNSEKRREKIVRLQKSRNTIFREQKDLQRNDEHQKGRWNKNTELNKKCQRTEDN